MRYQTLLAEAAGTRVLLNDTLSLPVLSTSPQQLQVQLPRAFLSDVYLLGQHKLSVEIPPYYADVQLQVAEAAFTPDLLPRLDAVSVLTDATGQPERLLLKGRHFPVNPRFFYTTLNGQFIFGHQTRILQDGSAEAELYLPDDEAAFLAAGPEYHLVFSTPFGTTPYSFSWEPEP